MKNKYLITSALPYINGELHIGHLIGCYLPSDIYARYCRAVGRDVLFICGADEHGTPAMVGAAAEGMAVIDYSNKYIKNHMRAVSDFNLSFDLYGRTHTDLHKKLIQGLFTRLDDLGLIEERETIQPYSVDDNMFLADRQLLGTCPACGFDGARGDQCDKCSVTYESYELINPRSTISGGTNIEMRPTKNLFFLASRGEDAWREWLIKAAPKWSKSAASIAHSWAAEGLRDTSITRDLSWGIPVNKPGYEHKVFYVWFDAPWGYVSISQAATKNWADWWKNPDCHYAQFMGKDNVKFHAVFFPEQQLAMDDNWKTVDQLKGMNFLNFEGNKISKSTGNGIFLDTAINDAPVDTWRYSLIASAPETDDNDFSIRRFADIVNKDLNGILGNFVSRVTKITEKNFGTNVPNTDTSIDFKIRDQINDKILELTTALDACEFRAAVFALRSLWAIGNEFMTITEPWTLVKNGETYRAGAVLNECFQLIDLYARISAPFIPDTAIKIQNIFSDIKDLTWPTQYEHRVRAGESFIIPDNLFERIDEDKVAMLTEKYTYNQGTIPTIIIAKIKSVDAHPSNPDLNVLMVDFGADTDIQIVCAAPNVRVGNMAALAMVGVKLQGARKPIATRHVGGIESHGMLLGLADIGGDKTDKNILELPADSIIGDEYKVLEK